MSIVLFPLCLTLILEMPFALLFKSKKSTALFVVFLTNAISNIVFNCLYVFAFNYNHLFFYLGEMAVVLLEGFVYFLYSRSPWVFLISLAANALSAGVGYGFNSLGIVNNLALAIAAMILCIEWPCLFAAASIRDRKDQKPIKKNYK